MNQCGKLKSQIFPRSCMTAMVVLWPKMKAPQIRVTTPQTVRTTLERRWQNKQKINNQTKNKKPFYLFCRPTLLSSNTTLMYIRNYLTWSYKTLVQTAWQRSNTVLSTYKHRIKRLPHI